MIWHQLTLILILILVMIIPIIGQSGSKPCCVKGIGIGEGIGETDLDALKDAISGLCGAIVHIVRNGMSREK